MRRSSLQTSVYPKTGVSPDLRSVSRGRDFVSQQNDVKQPNLTSPRRQQGASMLGVLFVAILICFIAYMIMKLGPSYMTNMKVSSTLKTVAEQATEERLSIQEIMRRIDARFHTDYVSVVTARNDLVLDKGDGYKQLRLSYQTEVPLFFNVSALLDFDNTAEY